MVIQPSFSTANYALIAENDAQFSSGGSFSEVVEFANANDADFVVMAVDGRAPIDVLMIKEGETSSLADLAGTTIGVKGKLPTSVQVMLAQEGLTRRNRLRHRRRRGVRPGCAHGDRGDRRRSGMAQQRTRRARAGRRRLRPVRHRRIRDPRVVRDHLFEPAVHRRAPDRRRGLHAGGHAWPRHRNRRPRSSGQHSPSS